MNVKISVKLGTRICAQCTGSDQLL